MLDDVKLFQEFEKQRAKILKEFQSATTHLVDYKNYLEAFQRLSLQEFRQKLKGQKPPALPIQFNIPLTQSVGRFSSIEEMKSKAIDLLNDSVVIAVDGSQIYPSKVITFPLAMVQAGHFSVDYPRDFPITEAKYNLDNEPRLLTPDPKVRGGENITRGEVSTRRMNFEIEYARSQINHLPKRKDKLLLIDGTLIYSFMIRAPPESRKEAITNLLELLVHSEKKKVLIAAFIDTSYAKDFSWLLHMLNGVLTQPMSDPAILKEHLDFLGDYTNPWICKRFPIGEYHDRYQGWDYTNSICFSYLRCSSGRPVRIEFPRWIWDSGRYNRMMELVFANAILGDGYPHALTRAHETAVIRKSEQSHFYNFSLVYLRDHLGLPVEETIKENFKHSFR